MIFRFILSMSLFGVGTTWATPKTPTVKCETGKPIVTKEIDFPDETYKKQITTCTFKSLVIVTTSIDFSYDCKFGCRSSQYYQQSKEKRTPVTTAQIFSATELLKNLNATFQKEHKQIAKTDPDCLLEEKYEPKTIEGIDFTMDENGAFLFSANNGVDNSCYGPLGSEYSASLPLDVVAPYLKF